MATQADTKELDFRKQLAEIDEALANAARARSEINQRQIQINQIRQDMFWKPWQVITAVVGGAAALVATTITLTKLFL